MGFVSSEAHTKHAANEESDKSAGVVVAASQKIFVYVTNCFATLDQFETVGETLDMLQLDLHL